MFASMTNNFFPSKPDFSSSFNHNIKPMKFKVVDKVESELEKICKEGLYQMSKTGICLPSKQTAKVVGC